MSGDLSITLSDNSCVEIEVTLLQSALTFQK